ncbi:MAG: flagellar motor switch protein FliM [Deltaproteobacteria bacterium]|nr:MAG: flagellar motor switch protein FliM [Deltaproteobacteria bacterium]
MNQILSQDEVDALLKGLDKGEIETDQKGLDNELDYQPYDWNTRGRNLKGDMPLLSMINDRFAVNLKNSLSASLRRVVDVDAGGLELIKFEEFQRALPIPTSLHLFKMEPLKGTGMLVLESRLVFNLLEAYLGGSGTDSTKVEGRDFTPIEKKIISKIVSIVLENMTNSWAEIYPIKASFLRSETNALAVNVVHPTEFLVSVKMEIEFNKPIGHIIICIPYASIQPIREKLSGSFTEESEDIDKLWLERLKSSLKEVGVKMSVDLGWTHLSVQEFLNMKEGDILVLENDPSSNLIGKVEGRPKFSGLAGKHKNKKVFKIHDMIAG